MTRRWFLKCLGGVVAAGVATPWTGLATPGTVASSGTLDAGGVNVVLLCHDEMTPCLDQACDAMRRYALTPI